MIEWALRVLAFGPIALLALLGVWVLLVARDASRRMR